MAVSFGKIGDPSYLQLAVLQVYQENGDIADPSQNSEDWCLCCDSRHDLSCRTRKAWSHVSGLPQRLFPWSIDAILRCYLFYRKQRKGGSGAVAGVNALNGRSRGYDNI